MVWVAVDDWLCQSDNIMARFSLEFGQALKAVTAEGGGDERCCRSTNESTTLDAVIRMSVDESR